MIIYLIIKGFIWGIAFRGEGELMISDQLGLCENKCLWYFWGGSACNPSVYYNVDGMGDGQHGWKVCDMNGMGVMDG